MKVQLREFKATNLKELKEDVTKLWVLKMDDCQCLRNLVESMPRRLEDVIRREGKPQQVLARVAVHPVGPFQGQNCINKEIFKHKYTCDLIYVARTVYR